MYRIFTSSNKITKYRDKVREETYLLNIFFFFIYRDIIPTITLLN